MQAHPLVWRLVPKLDTVLDYHHVCSRLIPILLLVLFLALPLSEDVRLPVSSLSQTAQVKEITMNVLPFMSGRLTFF